MLAQQDGIALANSVLTQLDIDEDEIERNIGIEKYFSYIVIKTARTSWSRSAGPRCRSCSSIAI